MDTNSGMRCFQFYFQKSKIEIMNRRGGGLTSERTKRGIIENEKENEGRIKGMNLKE